MSESSGTAHKVTLRRLQSWQSLNGVIGEKHSFLDSFHDRLSVANCGNPQGDLKETADLTHFYWIYWSFLDSSHEKRQEVQEQPSRWLERPDLSRALGYVMWLHNARFFKNFLQKKNSQNTFGSGSATSGWYLFMWLADWLSLWPTQARSKFSWLTCWAISQASHKWLQDLNVDDSTATSATRLLEPSRNISNIYVISRCLSSRKGNNVDLQRPN